VTEISQTEHQVGDHISVPDGMIDRINPNVGWTLVRSLTRDEALRMTRARDCQELDCSKPYDAIIVQVFESNCHTHVNAIWLDGRGYWWFIGRRPF
jgi:hypothetical protein